jgi:hypothetical protein
MGDSELSDSGEQSRLKAILRFASFAFPSLVTILMLFFCWRRHFNKESLEGAGLMIAWCGYMAVYLNRRSRGLAAAFFLASNGPDRDETTQENGDVIMLCVAVIIVGTIAYSLLKD